MNENMVEIEESNMIFGPFPADNFCYIEKTKICQEIQNKHDKFKIADFFLLRPYNGSKSVMLVVEAKSSSPRPGNQVKFDEFINDVSQKFKNSLLLGIPICLGRHSNIGIPPPSLKLQSTTQFKLVLVINGHNEEWLPPLQKALAVSLEDLIKILGTPRTDIMVINDIRAKEMKLISANNRPSKQSILNDHPPVR